MRSWFRKRKEPGADAPATEASESGRGDPEAGFASIQKQLHDTQLELQLLEERCADEQITIQKKYDKLRHPHFERRDSLLRKVPGFWASALLGHPSGLVNPAEAEALDCISGIVVRDNLDLHGSFEVSFSFVENKFFKERSVLKRVTFREESGEALETVEAAALTAAGPLGAKVLEEVSGRGRSVLGWLLSSQHARAEFQQDDLGDILRRDLWQDPLPHYFAWTAKAAASSTATASNPKPGVAQPLPDPLTSSAQGA